MVEEVAFEGGGKGGSSKSAFGGGGRAKGSWDGTLEPKGRDPRKFSLGGPKSAFWFKMAFPDKSLDRNTTLGGDSIPVSKHENIASAPAARLYNTCFSLGVSQCFSSKMHFLKTLDTESGSPPPPQFH